MLGFALYPVLSPTHLQPALALPLSLSFESPLDLSFGSVLWVSPSWGAFPAHLKVEFKCQPLMVSFEAFRTTCSHLPTCIFSWVSCPDGFSFVFLLYQNEWDGCLQSRKHACYHCIPPASHRPDVQHLLNVYLVNE